MLQKSSPLSQIYRKNKLKLNKFSQFYSIFFSKNLNKFIQKKIDLNVGRSKVIKLNKLILCRICSIKYIFMNILYFIFHL